jgi:hypothetical protein
LRVPEALPSIFATVVLENLPDCTGPKMSIKCLRHAFGSSQGSIWTTPVSPYRAGIDDHARNAAESETDCKYTLASLARPQDKVFAG